MTDKPCEHGASYNGANCWRCLRVERETLRQENAELKQQIEELQKRIKAQEEPQ